MKRIRAWLTSSRLLKAERRLQALAIERQVLETSLRQVRRQQAEALAELLDAQASVFSPAKGSSGITSSATARSG